MIHESRNSVDLWPKKVKSMPRSTYDRSESVDFPVKKSKFHHGYVEALPSRYDTGCQFSWEEHRNWWQVSI